MSYEKDETKGKNSPAPLPMYHRVVLKHVPTMVRRRYDSDLNNSIQDLPSNDSESEGDGVEDPIPGFAASDVDDDDASDVDDDADNEAEDGAQLEDATIGKCDTNQDTQMCTKDFGLSPSMHLKDKESEDDGPEYVNLANSLEAIVENRDQDNGSAKCDNALDCIYEVDGAEHSNLENYVDNSAKYEVQNIGHGSDIEVEDNRWDADVTKDANVVSYVDDSVENDMEVGNSDNKQGLLVENFQSEGDGTNDVNVAGYYTNDSYEDENKDKENENFYDKQGLLLEDSESHKEAACYEDASINMEVEDEGLETEPVTVTENSVTMMTFGKIATRAYRSPPPLPMYERKTLKHVPTMVRRRYDKDLLKFDANASEGLASDQVNESKGARAEYVDPAYTLSEVDDNTGDEAEDVTETGDALTNFCTKHDAQTNTENICGMYSEDGKSDGDGAEEVKLSSSVDEKENLYSPVDDNGKDIMQVNGHAKSDSDQDWTTEDDEAKDVNFTNSVNARVEDEVQGNELDSESYFVGDSAEDEVQEKKHGSSDKINGLHIEHCKSEGDGTDAATYCMVGCVKDEAQDKECVNFDNKDGLPVQDIKSHDNGAGDDCLATATDGTKDHDKGLQVSYCEHDFNPEDLKTTLARDGYDLCCPNCKRYITDTMILRRKEKGQQCQTTCFSCLIALFKCIQ